jgi:hypothetical protein
MTILDDVKAYLASVGVPPGRYSDAVLNQVISVEQAAQSHKCHGTGGQYPDLNEALCRRVQANLARRALPLGVMETSGDAEGRAFAPRADPEVRRLEAPYRKITVG